MSRFLSGLPRALYHVAIVCQLSRVSVLRRQSEKAIIVRTKPQVCRSAHRQTFAPCLHCTSPRCALNRSGSGTRAVHLRTATFDAYPSVPRYPVHGSESPELRRAQRIQSMHVSGTVSSGRNRLDRRFKDSNPMRDADDIRTFVGTRSQERKTSRHTRMTQPRLFSGIGDLSPDPSEPLMLMGVRLARQGTTRSPSTAILREILRWCRERVVRCAHSNQPPDQPTGQEVKMFETAWFAFRV